MRHAGSVAAAGRPRTWAQWHMSLVASWRVGLPGLGIEIYVPCIGRQIRIYCAAKGVCKQILVYQFIAVLFTTAKRQKWPKSMFNNR